MMKLDGKTAIVTGAGRGIGRSIAAALAAQGSNVVLAARSPAEIEAAAGELNGRRKGSALAVRCDVAVERDVDALFAGCARQFGGADILVNNAGIGAFAPVESLGASDFDRMWATNMRGVFLCTKAAIPFMASRREGDIVNIASLAGRNAFTGGAGYAATKWALIGFSRCLMLEVRERNIRVVTVCPGSVDTSFSPVLGSPRSRGAIPKAGDNAGVVLDALLMPRNVMVSEIDVRPTNPKG